MNKELLLNQMKEVMLSIEPLSEACWSDIISLVQEKEYPKNSYFAEEGDYPTDLGFVGKGTFRAFYRTADGVEYNKTFFTENTFMVALTAIVTQSMNLINIQALEDATVLKLNYHKFTQLYDQYHALERLVRKVIELEWVKKEVREIRLVLNNATERYQFFQEEHPGLENKIPQYHIASYLGVTPIQLSRIRAKMVGK
jgi:CRP-like cAMP-binding protein